MNNGIFKFKVFHRRSAACKAVAAVSAFAMLALTPVTALSAAVPLTGPANVLANVNGGAVISGVTGSMTLDTDLTVANINLASGGAGLINWSALNVGNGQKLGFTGGDFYNVVGGANASQIAGELNASGSLWIFNPAGVSFMNGAQVSVGGLFGVAAAGLENESAIKDAIAGGTSIPDPVFMASAASVNVGAGAKFEVGGDMALVGKSVAIESGADLSKVEALKIAAGEKVSVEEVGGGKVSLSIADFADVDDDINVTFGGGDAADINVGDEKHAGDVDVITEGSILVNEAVVAKGDVSFKTLAKPASEVVVGHKKMSVASGKLLQGKSVSATAAGKIEVNGDVEALDGDVDIDANEYIAVGSAATVKATGGGVTLNAVGNVNMGGTITASGDVVLKATGGEDATAKSVKVGFDGAALNSEASVSGKNVTMEGKMSSQVLAGSVTATGTDAKDGVTMSGGEYVAVNGAVSGKNVTLETTVRATLSKDHAELGMKEGDPAGVLVLNGSGVTTTETLNIDSKGAIVAQGSLSAGTKLDVSAANDIDISGKVDSQTVTDLKSENGKIRLSNAENVIAGTVNTKGDVDISAGENVNFDYGTVEAGADGNLTILGNAKDVTIKEAVAITGDFTVEGAGDISIESGITANDVTFKGAKTTVAGDVAGHDLAVQNAGGTASADLKQTGGTIDMSGKITAANIEQTGGTMKAGEKIVANITQAGCEIDTPVHEGNLTQTHADDIATVGEITGDVTQSAGLIRAKNTEHDYVNLSIDGSLTQNGGKISDVGTLTIGKTDAAATAVSQDAAGTIEATAVVVNVVDGTDVTLAGSANKLGSVGVVGATGAAGAVTVVDSDSTLVLDTLKADTLTVTAAGKVTQLGAADVAGLADVTAKDSGGTRKDISLLAPANKFGSVKATGALVEIKEADDVVIAGADATGMLLVEAGPSGDPVEYTGAITQTGAIKTGSGARFYGKSVTLTHGENAMGQKISARADNGDIEIVNGGTIKVDSLNVTASGSVKLTAKSGNVMLDSGAEMSAASLELTAENGDISLAGKATVTSAAGKATLSASKGSVTAQNADNAFGDVTASAKGNVALKDKGAVVLTDVQSKAGNVDVTAGGQITATKVHANGADKSVTLVSTDGGIEAGDVQAAKQATLTAANGVITKSGAGNVTASDLQAAAKSGIDLNTTVASATADTTDAGDIVLNETDAVTLTHVKAASGNVDVTAGGKMDVSGVVSATKGDDGTGNVTLATTAGDVDINAAVTAEATAKIEANGKMRVKGDVTGADVDLDAGDFINVAAGKTVKATAGGVSADSTGGNVDVYGTVKAENGSVGITASAEGKSIKVQGADAEVSGATSVTMTGGKSVQVLGGGKVESSGSVGATAAEYIAVNGSVNGKTGVTLETTVSDKLTAAVVEFPAGAPAGVIVLDGSVVSAEGAVTVTSKGSIMVDEQGGISGKTVGLVSNGEGDGQGVSIAGRVESTGGTLEITAKGKGGIQASGVLVADKGATTLTAANGSIDAQNADNDFQSLTATAKSVTLNDKNDITLTQVVSANGDIRVKAMSGDLTVADATVDKVTATGDIRLESSEGGIAIGAGVSGNNVTLFAKGNVNTKKTETSNGSLSALNGGDLLVESQNGSITLAADSSAEEVAALLAGNGSITSGKIDAATIYASGKGDVKVGEAIGNLVTRTDGDVDVEFKDEADHTISYNAGGHVKVTAKGGLVIDSATEDGADLKVSEVLWPTGRNDDRKLIDGEDAGTSVAGVTAGEEATLESTASGIEVRTGVDAGTVASLKAKTDVTVLGTVSGKAGVTIDACGDVTVDGAVVKAGEFTDETTGAVKSGSNADMAITAGNGVTVLEGATVAATGTAEITASGANGVTVTGADTKLVADKSLTVQATTGEGSVVVSKGAYVAARNSEEGTATAISAENGSVTVSGAATAVEAGKDLSISGAEGVTVDAAKAGSDKTLKLETTGDGSSVTIKDGAKVLAAEDIDIDAKGAVLVDNATVAAKGDVLVGDATTRVGLFTAQNGAAVSADGSVAAYVSANATVAKGTGDRTEVSGKAGVTIDAGGDVTVDGAVVKAGEFTDETTGAVKSGSNADMAITSGNGVAVLNGATVAATGTAEITASGANGVTVTGTGTKLVADKSLTVQATTGEGSVVVSEGAYVAARNSADGNTVTISSEKGSVTVSGAATAVEAGKNLMLTAKTGVMVDAAKAGSDKTLKLEATGDGSSVTVADGAKVLAAEDIDIDAKGAVLVDNATVSAKGDVLVGDATTRAGSFTAKNGAAVTADGSVAAYVAGNATVDGDTTSVTANNGDVIVDANGNIEVKGATITATGGDAILTAGKDDSTGDGRIDISGTVAATATDDQNNPNGGNVTLTAKGADVSAVDPDPAKSAVEITGTVMADQKATINATTGSVDVKGGTVVANGKDDANVGVAINAGSHVTVSGTVTAKGGDANIDAAGKVEVAGGKVLAVADDNAGTSGSVAMTAGASVKLTGAAEVKADKAVTITADGNDGAETPVAVHVTGTSTVEAGTAVAMNSTAAGDITIDTTGSVIAKDGTVKIDNKNGSVTIKNATIEARLAENSSETANVDVDATGAVTVDAATVAAKGDVLVGEDADGKRSGSFAAQNGATVAAEKSVAVYVSGDAEATKGTGERTEVSGRTGVTLDASGDVDVNGAVVKAGVVDEETGEVGADSSADLAMTAGKGVTVQGAAKVGASGTADIDAKDGDVTVDGAQLAANGAMTIDAEGGAVTVKGGAFVGGNSTVSVGMDKTGEAGTASLTVGDAADEGSSQLVAKGNLAAKATGSILVQKGAKVGSDANVTLEGASVTAQTGAKVLAAGDIDVDATDDVKVDGALVKAGAFSVDEDTGAVTIPDGAALADLTVTANGKVAITGGAEVGASGEAHLTANGADGVTVDGSRLASNGNMTIDATKEDAGSVEVKDGYVGTHGTLGITAAKDVTVTTSIVESTDDLTIEAEGDVTVGAGSRVGTDGNLEITASGPTGIKADGALVADENGKTATLTAANGTIDAQNNAANDLRSVMATAKSVTLGDKDDVALTYVAATEGDATVTAGSIEVGEVHAAEQATLTAIDSDIADGNADAANVTAKKALFSASNGAVGAGDDHIDISVDVVAATSKNGVFLTEENGIAVGTVGGVSGLKSTGNGAIVVETTAGNVDVTQPVEAKGAYGNVLIATNADDGDVTVGAAVAAAQNATVTAGNDVNVNANVAAAAGDTYVEARGGNVEMASGASITGNANGGTAFVGAAGSLAISAVEANTVWLKTGGSIENSTVNGGVKANNLLLDAGGHIGTSADKLQVDVDTIAAKASGGGVYLSAANSFAIGSVNASVEKVEPDGGLATPKFSGGHDGIAASGDVSLDANDSITVASNVAADGNVDIVAKNGNVDFAGNGQVGGSSVTITAGNDITQEDATVKVNNGYAVKTSVRAAVSAQGEASLVAGGSIGTAKSGTSNYVGVNANSVSATAGGDAAIAGAEGSGIQLGTDGISAGKNVALYTSRTIRPNGKTVRAGGEVAVTADDFSGGIVGVSVGSKLTANNLNRGSTLLAIFETRGGNKTPNVNTLPNKTIVFLDGRLAGGDLQTINKLGAMEAFPVQTPELKSEQGIFGNPVFLHDELGVTNPLAVGAIDFLLLDIPRLTLSSDFPLEVEKQVAAAGLNPTTSYWFGQDSNNEKKEDAEGKSGEGNNSGTRGSGDAPTGENQTAMN